MESRESAYRAVHSFDSSTVATERDAYGWWAWHHGGVAVGVGIGLSVELSRRRSRAKRGDLVPADEDGEVGGGKMVSTRAAVDGAMAAMPRVTTVD